MKKDNVVKTEKTIDASGKALGRLASEASSVLMGKDNVSFQRNRYSGSPVKIVNASKIKITTKKLDELYHLKYSGYPGGLRVIKGSETVEKKGFTELVKMAIYQMLPDNKLRREMMKNLVIEE